MAPRSVLATIAVLLCAPPPARAAVETAAVHYWGQNGTISEPGDTFVEVSGRVAGPTSGGFQAGYGALTVTGEDPLTSRTVFAVADLTAYKDPQDRWHVNGTGTTPGGCVALIEAVGDSLDLEPVDGCGPGPLSVFGSLDVNRTAPWRVAGEGSMTTDDGSRWTLSLDVVALHSIPSGPTHGTGTGTISRTDGTGTVTVAIRVLCATLDAEWYWNGYDAWMDAVAIGSDGLLYSIGLENYRFNDHGPPVGGSPSSDLLAIRMGGSSEALMSQRCPVALDLDTRQIDQGAFSVLIL